MKKISILKQAKDIQTLGQKNLWVIYGKSGSGKTTLASTFPKPLLYLSIEDDGSNTIADVSGIRGLKITNLEELNSVLDELIDTKTDYKTVVLDTFSFIVNIFMENNSKKNRPLSGYTLWGTLADETQALIKKCKFIAESKNVILTCHEVMKVVDGMESEITPHTRPNVSPAAQSYLEGMSNFGIHCTVITKDVKNKEGKLVEVSKHAVHLSQNQYYWAKTQKPASIIVPKILLDPTYSKIMKILKGETQ